MPTAEGTLTWVPLSQHLELVAAPVAAAAALVPSALVAQIDADLADTTQYCAAYDVDPAHCANCVVVAGRRASTTYAAVLVLATDRADVNKVVRKELDVRRISFADQGVAEELTDMRQGGITPVGLPADWVLLIDEAVAGAGRVVIGGGVRGSKLLVEAADLVALPNVRVLALAQPAG